jgi:hypothetical protein
MYLGIGRPSIAPGRLRRGSLLQIIFSVRSERQLMERWSRWTTISRSAGSWGSALTIPFGITRFRNATACSRPTSLKFRRVLSNIQKSHFTVDGTSLMLGPRLRASCPDTTLPTTARRNLLMIPPSGNSATGPSQRIPQIHLLQLVPAKLMYYWVQLRSATQCSATCTDEFAWICATKSLICAHTGAPDRRRGGFRRSAGRRVRPRSCRESTSSPPSRVIATRGVTPVTGKRLAGTAAAVGCAHQVKSTHRECAIQRPYPQPETTYRYWLSRHLCCRLFVSLSGVN